MEQNAIIIVEPHSLKDFAAALEDASTYLYYGRRKLMGYQPRSLNIEDGGSEVSYYLKALSNDAMPSHDIDVIAQCLAVRYTGTDDYFSLESNSIEYRVRLVGGVVVFVAPLNMDMPDTTLSHEDFWHINQPDIFGGN
ncbi:hypothetical protein HED60_19460 [Planctomycetales bacterium ZRK34]|nr:hypothetical protein HED60_19460 [Planctomycetales bacterium ZRK34]